MLDQLTGLGGLFISAFISSTVAPGGSEALLAYLVAGGHYPFIQLVLVASIGNTLGALTTWWLGALAAKKYPVEKVLADEKQKSVALVRKYGHWSLLFSWLPVVGDGLCFAGGWLQLTFVPAVIAIAIGKVLRYSLVAVLFAH